MAEIWASFQQNLCVSRMKGRIQHLSSTALCYKIWFVKYRILVLFKTLCLVVLILLVSLSSENV